MRRILLIDADRMVPLLTETLVAGLHKEHEILKTSSGREALEFLKKSYAGNLPLPDVIFLDLTRSENDGLEFLQSVLKLTIPGIERVRIAVLSSSDDPKDRARAKLLGVEYYLTAPATVGQVKGILE